MQSQDVGAFAESLDIPLNSNLAIMMVCKCKEIHVSEVKFRGFFLKKNVVVFMSPFFWQFFTDALLINEFFFGMRATLTT
jgi:hypothetical protein